MSNNLAEQLKKLRSAERRVKPDEAWVKTTRGTLLMQVKNTLPPAARVTLKTRFSGFFRYALPREAVVWVRRPALAVASFLVLILGGSIMSVSAAEKSLPGDFLYTLKLATEQARMIMTTSNEDKVKLKTEFTSRRVEELKIVVKAPSPVDKPQRVAQVTEILKRDMTTLKEQLNEVSKEGPADKAVEMAKLVDQNSNQVIAALQETKSDVTAETKEKITEAQSAAADTGVKAIEVLAQKHQESNDAVPASDVAQAIQDHAKTVADATLQYVSSTGPTVPSTMTSATGTAATLNDLQSASTTASTTSSLLPSLVDQMKDATTQAFAYQKAADQLAASSSTTADADAAAAASGTTDIIPITSGATTTSGTTPKL
jgi:hypothetical protein